MSQEKNPAARKDPYAALRSPDFRLLFAGRFITTLGDQIVSFSVGWELWLRTHNELALGLVGLVQVVPVIFLSLPAGHVADRYNRKRIVMITLVFLSICSLGLALISFNQGPIPLIYLCLLGIGIARAFNNPAVTALLPQTVPPEDFTSAATWSSSAWQLAAVIGPSAAGVSVALLNGVGVNYLFQTAGSFIFIGLLIMMHGRELPLAKKAATLESLYEGVRFIRNTKEILAAITLDMFAVLFGGAVTLLPVYATDILKVGAQGLGLMRAAPSIGALLMALTLTQMPAFRHAGRTLLLAVAGFGLATIVFGFSGNFWLSIAMLVLLGGLDNISVVIRSTLMMTYTPDEMRGRAAAVNSIFIGASNELGGFESGATAALFGPVISVVGGGIGTLIVVLTVARTWPQIRNLKTLDAPAA